MVLRIYLFVVSPSFNLSLISQSNKLFAQYLLESMVNSNISDNFSSDICVITELSPGSQRLYLSHTWDALGQMTWNQDIYIYISFWSGFRVPLTRPLSGIAILIFYWTSLFLRSNLGLSMAKITWLGILCLFLEYFFSSAKIAWHAKLYECLDALGKKLKAIWLKIKYWKKRRVPTLLDKSEETSKTVAIRN